MRRRSVIKALAAAPLASLAAPSWGLSGEAGPILVFDNDNALSRAVAKRAEALGLSTRATNGEVAALLLAKRTGALPALWGVTGYAEMMLARDVFRSQGRAMAFVQPLGAKACTLSSGTECTLPPLVRRLLDPMVDAGAPTTAFFWGV